jgi:hypothetical protein
LAGVYNLTNGSVDLNVSYNYNFYIFKSKCLPVTSYAGTEGSSSIALLILKLGVKIVVVGRCKTPCTLPPENRVGTHFKGGCVDPRAGLDSVEKRKCLAPPGFESRNVQPIAI